MSGRSRLRLHAFEPASRANGPGLRAVLWLQGCTIGCPGCFNPATHRGDGGSEVDVRDLAARIASLDPPPDGITVSGGEPFEQPAALLDLLEGLDRRLGRIVFTGLNLEEVRRLPLGAAMLSRIDALIAGRYVASLRLARGLIGSANKRIHFLTNRYGPRDLEDVPPAEVIVEADGTLTVSGIDPVVTLGVRAADQR